MSEKQVGKAGGALASATLAQLQSLAQAHTEAAINALVAVMTNDEASDASRVAAANALLDRGWGKPTAVADHDEGAPERPSTIKRVIVERTGNPDSLGVPPAAR
jgi:hypothetical protein